MGSIWSQIQAMDSRTSTLVMIGFLMAYVFFQMIKLVMPKKRNKYVGARDSQGLYHGYGQLQCINKDFYKGDFVHGKFHGKGEYIFYKAGSYVGDFRDGHFEGKGREVYPTGAAYEGEFKAGKRFGKGVMQYPSGQKYEGQWNLGKRSGKGKLILPNGSRFEGIFKDNMRDGDGVWTAANGAYLRGCWEKNKLKTIYEKREVDGSLGAPADLLAPAPSATFQSTESTEKSQEDGLLENEATQSAEPDTDAKADEADVVGDKAKGDDTQVRRRDKKAAFASG